MLGSAQFGIDYGISNDRGKTPFDEVSRIIDACLLHGIGYIDTACLYGDSEEVIGRLTFNDKFKIVTKTEHLVGALKTPDISARFLNSLNKLDRSAIYGLLFHNASALLSSDGQKLYQQAETLRSQGLVEKIGVSVYCSKQVNYVLEHFDIDLIQLPVNVLDQRLIQDESLKKLKDRDIEIHCRSAFLQGLLLMDPERLNPYFSKITPVLQRWHKAAMFGGGSAISAALGFLKNVAEIDRIIVGVNNVEQLNQLVSAYKIGQSIDCSSYALTDSQYLDPSNWSL